VEQFRARVKIYATDVDDEALTQARQAAYTPKDVEEVPPAHLAKYFEQTPTHYVFHKEVRRSVIFGRHDLTQDAPISRIDLLLCRNTLMYFNSETQARILGRFHFALNDGGYLFLGKAEMLLTHGQLFTPVDLKRRVFRKVPNHENRPRLLRAAALAQEGVPTPMNSDTRLRDLAHDTNPLPELVIDSAGRLAIVNQAARALFALGGEDLGRPFRDLA